MALGDLDGDGVLDIVTANGFGNSVSVLLGNADGSFADRTDFATGISPNSVALGDLDGDGDLDLVTANGSNFTFGSVSVLLNRLIQLGGAPLE